MKITPRMRIRCNPGTNHVEIVDADTGGRVPLVQDLCLTISAADMVWRANGNAIQPPDLDVTGPVTFEVQSADDVSPPVNYHPIRDNRVVMFEAAAQLHVRYDEPHRKSIRVTSYNLKCDLFGQHDDRALIDKVRPHVAGLYAAVRDMVRDNPGPIAPFAYQPVLTISVDGAVRTYCVPGAHVSAPKIAFGTDDMPASVALRQALGDLLATWEADVTANPLGLLGFAPATWGVAGCGTPVDLTAVAPGQKGAVLGAGCIPTNHHLR